MIPTAPYPGIQDERTSQGSPPSLDFDSSSFGLRFFFFNFCGVSKEGGAQPLIPRSTPCPGPVPALFKIPLKEGPLQPLTALDN